jgi:hypothetical protein
MNKKSIEIKINFFIFIVFSVHLWPNLPASLDIVVKNIK